MQNIGISSDVHSKHYSNASNNNPIMAFMPYFGVNKSRRTPIFKCKWANGKTGVRVNGMGFTLVELNIVAYMDESFIMVEQSR